MLNISAMSFGALSKNAVLALNTGAARGDFVHNTGQGGISQYHLEPGGDLIWQIGTDTSDAELAMGPSIRRCSNERQPTPQ
jgi:glutamate synthase domain-containing protein 2